MGSLPRLRSLVSKLRFAANPHAHIRPAGTLAAIGLVASLINPVAQPTAAAAPIEEPILASLEINKVADGTGHGTAGATFVNFDNEFNPGDNTPNDGIVSSRDVVLYQMSLNLTAGKRRTVKVSWDLSDAPYLSSDLNYCTDGTQVTAQKNDDGSCSFTIPAGVVESVVRTLYLRATDTVGTYQPNQAPKLIIERVPSDTANTGQRFETSVAKVGVVSAPAADLTIRDYGRDDEGAIDERRVRMSEDGSPTEGYFDITVDAVGYPGYSSNGASTGGPWSTNIDVTAFPKSTRWTWTSESGEPTSLTATEQDGKRIVRLENQHGAGQLNFSIPFAAIDGRDENASDLKESDKALAYNGYKEFNIQLIPDEDVFQTGDLKNLGTGGEPGRNQARDVTTEDSTTGSKAGYPFPNNDWSRAVIDRGPGPGDGRFGKRIQLPYTEGATIFDEGNVYFDKASSIRTVTTSTKDGSDQVAQGAQSRNRPHLILRKNKGKPSWWDEQTQVEYMGDVWNPLEQQWDGSVSMQLDYVEDGQTKTLDLQEGREYEVVGYILRQDLYNGTQEATCKTKVEADPSTACTGADEASPQSMGVDETGKNLRKELQWRAGDPRLLPKDEQKNVAGIQVKLIRHPHFVTKDESYVDVYKQAVTSGESRLVLGEYDWSADATKWAAHLTIGTVIQKSYDQSSKVWDHAILERKTSVKQQIPTEFGSLPDAVVAKAPQAPLLTLDALLVDPKNPSTGKSRAGGNALPGDTASYTVNAHLDNIPLSGTAVQPTLALTLPATLIDPVSTSSFWVIKEIREPNAKGEREVIFEPKDPTYVPQLDLTGKAVLPTLTFDATVSNLAVSKIAVPAVAYATTQARGIVPSYSLATQAKIVELNVVTDGGTSSAIKTIIPYTEVNDQIGYHFNIYAGGTKFSASDKAVTVIRFPANNDEAMLGDDGKGLDGSWTDYPNGDSAFNGTYTLAHEVEYRSDNGTPTQILYSRTNTNSFAPEDFEWLTWEELGDNKTVAAIKVVSKLQKRPVPGTDETFPVAAADGTIYLQPADGTNRKGDKYVMWLGNTRFYNNNDKKIMDPKTNTQLMGTVPWAAKAEITASEISGTVWSDDNRDYSIGQDEKRLKNVTVLLWRYNADGTKQDTPFRTTVTDDKGFYSFDQLHSGNYETEVKRIDGSVGEDGSLVSTEAHGNGVFTTSTSYYNQSLNVDNTRSWKDTGEYAKNTSGIIALPITSSQPRVDYGFAVIDPKVTLDKTNVTQDCTPTDCDIYWDVTVKNVGNDPIPMDSAVLTDSMSNDNKHVLTSATVGMQGTGVTKVKFQQMGMGQTYGMALDQDGYLWAWGNLPAAESDTQNRTTYSTPVRYPVYDQNGKAIRFTSLSVGAYHWVAIDANGKLWGAGANRAKTIQDSATTTVETAVQILPDGNSSTIWAKARAGWFGTFAMDTTGKLYLAGTNYQKQVDPNLTDNYSFFREIPPARFEVNVLHVADISLARNVYFIHDADTNRVWSGGDYNNPNLLAWGSNNLLKTNYHYVVDEQKNPIEASMVTADHKEGVALSKDQRSLYLWGDWTISTQKTTAVKQSISTLTANEASMFTSIAAGDNRHLLALDEKSRLWSIDGGSNPPRATKVGLPDGALLSALTVGKINNKDVSFINYGALDSDGYMYTWGTKNKNGELGTGDTDSHPSPVDISPATKPLPDITGQKIDPISETDNSTTHQTVRTYGMLRDLQPNTSIVYHFTTKVPRPKSDEKAVTVSNQARFSARNVPYSGTGQVGVPLARDKNISAPAAPERTNFNATTKDITGTTACYTGTDASGTNTPDTEKEHSFSLKLEDSCDQVGARIAAQMDNTPDTSIKGVISGRYWFDENRDGIQNDNETRKFPGQLVTLLDENGKAVATTTTDAEGKYAFRDLDIATYHVMFSRVRFADFTKADAEETSSQPQDILTDTGGSSQKDSDASLSDDDYGTSTVTINLGDYPVRGEGGTVTSYEKDYIDVGVGPYKFNLMPHTGLGRWIFALSILVVLTGGAGLWLLRRRALAD